MMAELANAATEVKAGLRAGHDRPFNSDGNGCAVSFDAAIKIQAPGRMAKDKGRPTDFAESPDPAPR